MNSPFPPNADNWGGQQAHGGARSGLDLHNERRNRPDRRQRIWWSLVYGNFRPRRRRPARRTDDGRYHALDWHGPHLWAVSIGVLILSVADAFMTLILMSGGAVEVNPFMAMFVGRNVAVFAALKMAITGISIMLLVFLARYRFLRLVRVDVILYCILAAYLILIGHELGMLRQLADAHLLPV
jgi:hypothetical protein